MGPPQTFYDRWKKHIALAIVLLGLVGVTFAVTSSDDGNGGKTVTVVIHSKHGLPVPLTSTVDTAAKPGVQPKVISVPAVAQAQVTGTPELNQGSQLRDESPAGVTPKQLNESQDKQEQLAQTDQLPIVQPDAAPEQRGCASRFVRNYSTRRGVRPREFTMHYTVSPNRPGWSDVDAVVNLFNHTSSQASSNYVIDSEGHCAYIVRESDKAWTQAGGNPYSISIEVINSGHEPLLAGSAGMKKIGLVVSDALKRWQIPLQRGSVSGCVPTRPGIIMHNDWGLCGGGHFDIKPFPIDPVIAAVRAARGSGAKPVTAVDRKTCQRLNHFRADRAKHVKVSPHRIRINVNRRKALASRHVVCTAKGPVRK